MKNHALYGLALMVAMTGSVAADEMGYTARICRAQSSVEKVVLLAGTTRENRVPFATWEKSVAVDTFELPSALQTEKDVDVDLEAQTAGTLLACLFMKGKEASSVLLELKSDADGKSSSSKKNVQCPC